MANMKQDGSNVTSVEFSTGRCPVNCEQCFVNFGQTGGTLIKNIMDPRKILPGATGSTRGWRKYATTVKDDFGKPCWKEPRAGTVKIPRSGTSFKKLSDEEFEALARLKWPKLTDQAAVGIPKQPDPLATRRPSRRMQVDKGSREAGTMPWFLRASSQSDSGRSPCWWCEEVLAAWGDYCFFNSAILSCSAPDVLRAGHWERAWHKVVVTANGGHQRVPHVKQWGQKTGVALSEVIGSMGERAPADFLAPLSLTDAGLAMYESQVKFYRLRVLPTIQGELNVEAPVVETQMRFLSLAHALEFCRKYGIEVVPYVSSKKDKDVCARFGVPHKSVPKGEPSALMMRYRGRDNASPRAGEWTEMMIESNYYRSSPEQYDGHKYVCDRTHNSCVACGLCASLDGTQEGDVNQLNVLNTARGEVLMAPEPYGADYLPLPASAHGDPNYFASLFQLVGGRWQANPEPDEETIAGALREIAVYLEQGRTPGDNACESWNTHEDVATLTARCYFQALRLMQREGVGREEACAATETWIAQVTNSFVLDGIEELPEMWDGESKWNDLFGLL